MKFFNSSYPTHISDSSDNKFDASAFVVMAVTMIIASVLSVFPANQLIANMRPLFMFVVMLFWVMHRPENFGIWFVFVVGVISDFLLDTRLGQQAFSGVLAVFAVQYLTKNANRINDVVLWLLSSIAIVIFSITLLVLQYLDGQVIIWRNGLPMFTSILLWPVVVFFLKRF